MSLLRRARAGDIVGVMRLLEKGVHVDKMHSNHQTALYGACENGCTNIAQYLLRNGASVNLHGTQPLKAAVGCNHYDCVKLLLEYHADTNCTNSYGYTPMEVAILKRYYSIILLLLEYDAKPSTSLGEIAVQLLQHAEAEHAKAIEKLIDGNFINLAVENIFLAAFDFAFRRGSVELAEKILSNKSYSQIEQLYPEAVYYSAKNNWPDILSKLFEKGVDVNALTEGESPLSVACKEGHESIVRLLLDKGGNTNVPNDFHSDPSDSKHKLPLFVAVDKGSSDIITSLLNAGANVNAVNAEGRNVVCFAVEKLTNSSLQSADEMIDKISAVHLLIQHGANFNMQLPHGRSPLYLALTLFPGEYVIDRLATRCAIELLELMVKHGAMLQDSSSLSAEVSRQSLNSILYSRPSTLAALATFDSGHEFQFLLDLFRAGVGFQLLALCCNAVVTIPREAMSISLCKAAVLAGYMPSDEELQQIQLTAARDDEEGHLIQQLVNWLNEDRQQVPSLLRQCRVVIRRQLSVALHFQSILPAIDKLPLPNKLKLYLQFDGPFTEVDLNERMSTRP